MGSIRTWLTIIVLASLAGAGWFAYNYYATTQAEIRQLVADNAKKQITIEQQQKAAEEAEKFRQEQVKLMNDLNLALAESEKPLQELQRILARHDLEKLAREKPGLIEKRINDATREVFRSLECDTGAC